MEINFEKKNLLNASTHCPSDTSLPTTNVEQPQTKASTITTKEEEIEKSASNKLNKVIVPHAFLLTLLCYLDRGNLGFAASDFCEALGLTYSQYGLGVSIFYITYLIFEIPSNIILNFLGAPIWLSLLMVFWGISALLMAFVQNVHQYYIVRLLLGLAEAGTFPGIYYYLTTMYTNRTIGYAYGWTHSGAVFATPISAPMAALFLSLDGVWGLEGWQWLFLIEGLMPIFFGIGLFLMLPKDIDSAHFLDDDEKKYLNENLAVRDRELDGGLHQNKFSSNWTTFYKIIKNKDFWYLTMSTIFQFMGVNITLFYTTLIISNMMGTGDDSPSETCASDTLSVYPILLTAIPYIFGGIGSILIGLYTYAVPHRPYFLALCYILSMVSALSWIAFQDNLIVGIILLSISIACTNAAYPLIMSLLSSEFTKETSSMGMALFNSLAVIGGILGPSITGYMIEHFGFNGGMVFMAITSLSAAAFTVFVKENHQHHHRHDDKNKISEIKVSKEK